MKAYTNLEQSKKLAEILPLESADMEYLRLKETNATIGSVPFVKDDSEVENSAYDAVYERIPCWSLAALLDILQYPTLFQRADQKWGCTAWIDAIKPYSIFPEDSHIDACYEMILKLHELKML